MGVHRVYVDRSLPHPGERFTLGGEEAHHAIAVKRVTVGQIVELLDGQGGVAIGKVVEPGGPGRANRELVVRVDRRADVGPPRPELTVVSASPKGQRLDDMIDQLSQLGVWSWAPLVTERGVVQPRLTKLDRLERIAREACKQCGRAWIMRLEKEVTLQQAGARESAAGGEPVRVVVADGRGGAYVPDGSARIRLLVGPEGGWTEQEIGYLRDSGASVVRFGPHTMRIETAACAASAVVMDRECLTSADRSEGRIEAPPGQSFSP